MRTSGRAAVTALVATGLLVSAVPASAGEWMWFEGPRNIFAYQQDGRNVKIFGGRKRSDDGWCFRGRYQSGKGLYNLAGSIWFATELGLTPKRPKQFHVVKRGNWRAILLVSDTRPEFRWVPRRPKYPGWTFSESCSPAGG